MKKIPEDNVKLFLQQSGVFSKEKESFSKESVAKDRKSLSKETAARKRKQKEKELENFIFANFAI